MYHRLKVRKKSTAKKSSIDSQDKDLFGIKEGSKFSSSSPFSLRRKFEDIECKEAIESAVKLWSVAFFHITDRRKKNILNQTNPFFLSLLDEPSNFSSSKVNDPFGRKFIKKMVEAAEMEAKLDQANGLCFSTRSRSDKPGFRLREAGAPFVAIVVATPLASIPAIIRLLVDYNKSKSSNPQRYLSVLSTIMFPVAGRLYHLVRGRIFLLIHGFYVSLRKVIVNSSRKTNISFMFVAIVFHRRALSLFCSKHH